MVPATSERRPVSDGSVLIVGAGALGGSAAVVLSAAGLGRLGLADEDRVELSNLPRQLLFGPSDLGRPKVEVATAKLSGGITRVTAHRERVTAGNAVRLISAYDLVLDATDDPPTKFLLNDTCVASGKPLVHAGVVGLEGQLTTILPGRGPCLRCLFPEPPEEGATPSCSEAGVLGPVAGLVGGLQAREALKYLGDEGELLVGRLLAIDLRSLRCREIAFRRSPDCPACARVPNPRPLGLYCAGSQAREPRR